jgi:hypothetical protein
MKRSRIALGAGFSAIILIVAVASGVWLERQRLFGYHSYSDCMIHEAKKAGEQAEFLVRVLEDECEAQTDMAADAPWEKYQKAAAVQSPSPHAENPLLMELRLEAETKKAANDARDAAAVAASEVAAAATEAMKR